MLQDPKLGWLACERSVTKEMTDSSRLVVIKDLWYTNQLLPSGCFAIDKEVAARIYEEGIRLCGCDWEDNADNEVYDRVVQMALLGEIRYG